MATNGSSKKSSDDSQRSLDEAGRGVGLGSAAMSDDYMSRDNRSNLDTSIAMTDDQMLEDAQRAERSLPSARSRMDTFRNDTLQTGGGELDPFASRGQPSKKIIDRQSDYQKRAYARMGGRQLSPERHDPFATPFIGGDKTPAPQTSSYSDVMDQQQTDREQQRVLDAIKKKQEQEADAAQAQAQSSSSSSSSSSSKAKKRNRWDSTPAETAEWDDEPVKKVSRWDATPAAAGLGSSTPAADTWDKTPAVQGSMTPGPAMTPGRMAWDSTPGLGASTPGRWDATPGTGGAKKSRWDETPAVGGATPGLGAATPMIGGATPAWGGATPALGSETPAGMTPSQTPGWGSATPSFTPGMQGMATPAPDFTAMTPEQIVDFRVQQDVMHRNQPLSDQALDEMFEEMPGYEIIDSPAHYQPIRTPSRKLLATPTPFGAATPGFEMMTPAPGSKDDYGIMLPKDESLPNIKPEDAAYFAALCNDVDEENLSPEQAKERMIMECLLKVKNGTPPQRKSALKMLSNKARWFGAGPLFNQILPLLMSPTLEDQERHLLVKVIDRVLYKLDDLVRPFVHKILVVIEPLLIDEDYYARVEGREIISNLSKAAGLATMISTMRPDIDNVDEYVRNTTARAFSVVASALGIPALMPFLKAVCQSKKSWQARHTGVKIVQQIAILMGCAVLPHLRSLVDIIEGSLEDEQSKCRTICALSLAALAEAAAPYGIESFDSVLRPLWKGIRQHRGKTLAAFLKAIGYIIPLMDSNYANYYTREVMVVVIREFATPDEEMKKIVLKVVKQCVGTDGVEASYIREEILPEYFRNFWVRRMALDRRNYKQLVETTVEVAKKTGGAEIIGRIVEDLKDESEPYRKMVMETIDETIKEMGATDIDQRLEELLIDGILFAFQEQTGEDTTYVILNGFGTVVNALGSRVKPYLPQICGIIKWRLNNKAARVRQQAADLIQRIAVCMKACGEEQLMGHLGVVLYEYLGEEYPEVLGSILGAMKSIVNVIGMQNMTPPIKDLLPRLTPILKNRHEKVQENCIDLVGRIADRGAEFVSAREWMRICFELLDMLKAHKKAIRRATVNTFGYIAKAIGPQDVLSTLLNNLRVQERQNRVCTTVAIAIVAETCSPFTVLPALMNEYKVPEMNVQNGVLKSMSFLFEYIDTLGKDYIYAVTPLLEDALQDRDMVHRQIAMNTVKHLALGVAGLGCEDALLHLLNLSWPNMFEVSPHVISGCLEAIAACRVAVGPATVLQYLMQGLFHPARKVRSSYWKIYNEAYIGAQDACVPVYPILMDEADAQYRRHELEYHL